MRISDWSSDVCSSDLELGINVNNGMAQLYEKIKTLPESQYEEVMRDLHACHEHRPELAMVDSAKGITNFHSPNDIIVDASMPAMIRNGGKLWGADARLKDGTIGQAASRERV